MQNRKRDTEVQNRLLDSVGEDKGEMFWENSIKTCIWWTASKHVYGERDHQRTASKHVYGETDHQPRLDAWDKCLGLVHWEDPEESGGEGGGRGIGMGNTWLIHVNVWQNPLKCCEVISLQLIKINEKKK